MDIVKNGSDDYLINKDTKIVKKVDEAEKKTKTQRCEKV